MKIFDALRGLKPKPLTPVAYTRSTHRVVRHKQEDVIKRLRESSPQAKEETPVFSRNAQERIETPIPVRPQATSLSDLKDKWTDDAITHEDHPVRKKVDRSKTRLIGFHDAHLAATDPFGAATPVTKTTTTKYPVGWLVVVDGPGCGESFTLLTGMTQMGRGEDQPVHLDFGDASISRTNHAAIVYDTTDHTFYIGHGGKANIVRVNDAPLISNQTLSNGDKIRIGETTLKLMIFATQDFNWTAPVEEEAQDVEAS